MSQEADFFLVGTPIGNLKDISYRAIETLRSVDLIYCEDTRRSLKLLNHYEIKKPLKSVPYFKERRATTFLLEHLQEGLKVAYVTDAGMPGLSDPGSILLGSAREAGYRVEVIGGTSSLTHFIAGLGQELPHFQFVGFLPAKTTQREKVFRKFAQENLIFFESPHRLVKTLRLLSELFPNAEICLAKELSKISESFFFGTAGDLLERIPSWKGEWLGLVWSHVDAKNA